jgi:putative molybdopterin biosynthesis protein
MIPLERRKNFLALATKEEAEKRWREALRPGPLGVELVPIEEALGRVLGEDVRARTDLPPFDRAVVDGFAVRAEDTFGADEEKTVRLLLAASAIAAGGAATTGEVAKGTAIEIATGAPIPRGADSVVMVEHCETKDGAVFVGRAVVPREGIQAKGSDMRAGETVFRKGDRLSARETGVLAGQGLGALPCYRRPRVAVISTGDELRAPGSGELAPGQIYDSNARIVADLVRESGGEAHVLGIARDTREDLRAHFERAQAFDAVILSGGTSKGAGDLTYRLVGELGKPGILVHGVQIKPGKPVVLAAWERKPVVVLPGFPSSAAITFDVFVKPVLRALAGLDAEEARERREARLALTIPAGMGRHEVVLCHLVRAKDELVAFPIVKGSGSVSAFAQADGFFEVAASRERAEKGEKVQVTLLGGGRGPADLVVGGVKHAILEGLVTLLLERTGLRAKVVATGSVAGAEACARGEIDLALVATADADRMSGLVLLPGFKRKKGAGEESLAFVATMAGLGDSKEAEEKTAAGAFAELLVSEEGAALLRAAAGG